MKKDKERTAEKTVTAKRKRRRVNMGMVAKLHDRCQKDTSQSPVVSFVGRSSMQFMGLQGAGSSDRLAR